MPFTEMNCVPHAHELSEDQSLDGRDTEWREGYPVRLQDCGLEIRQGGEADVEIGGNNQKFLQFVDCSLAEGTLYFGANLHVHLHPERQRRVWSRQHYLIGHQLMKPRMSAFGTKRTSRPC